MPEGDVAIGTVLSCPRCGQQTRRRYVPADALDESRSTCGVLAEAIVGARTLLAMAYDDDEHDDSPGNMAYAILTAVAA